MLQPLIYFTGNKDIYDNFIDTFRSIAPKELSCELLPNQMKEITLSPIIQFKEHVDMLDDRKRAPNVVIYLLLCASKQEYESDYKDEIELWYRQTTRPYIHPMCIFINDPKVTKSKQIFGGFANFYQYLQENILNLQLVNVQTSGEFQEESIQKLWQVISVEIIVSYQSRIAFLTDLVRPPYTIEIFKNFLDLAYIYEQMTLYQKACQISDTGLNLAYEMPDLFPNLFTTQSLATIPIEFSQTADGKEDRITENLTSLYDLMFLFFKRHVQCLQFMNKLDAANEYAFDFVVKMNQRVEKEGNVEEPLYHFWLCRALSDIIPQCLKNIYSGFNGKSDVLVTIKSVRWYLIELNALRGMITPETTIPDKSYQSLFKIVQSDKETKEEILRNLENVWDVATKHKLTRTAALAIAEIINLYKFDESYKNSLETIIMGGFSSVINKLSEDMLKTLSYNKRMACSFKILKDKASKHYSAALNVINDTLTSQEVLENQKDLLLYADVPVRFEFDPTKSYTQLEESVLSLVCRCNFEGEFTANLVNICFLGDNGCADIFCAEKATIKEGNVINFEGVFRQSGGYTPIFHQLMNGSFRVHHALPLNDSFIYVKPLPLPVDLKINMPGFLLPNRWQHAQLIVTTTRFIENLELNVSGIHFQQASLRLASGELREPTSGLTYQNIPPGVHNIFLPVNPEQSGVLNVNTLALGQNQSRSSPYTVSNFLEVKVVYKETTNIAELTAFLSAESEITIKKVDFFNKDGAQVNCKSFGIPMKLMKDPVSSLFKLDSNIEVAEVWIQQDKMKPFPLRITVEPIDTVEKDMLQVSPPLTPVVEIELKI